jgi:hypothetical protein
MRSSADFLKVFSRPFTSSRVTLWGRDGVDYQARYPELAILRQLPAETVVDGELVHPEVQRSYRGAGSCLLALRTIPLP